jgi:hypothetical protein
VTMKRIMIVHSNGMIVHVGEMTMYCVSICYKKQLRRQEKEALLQGISIGV